MKLNGWQRLWILVTVPWLVFVIYEILIWLVVKGHSLDWENGVMMAVSLIAPFAVYIVVLIARRAVLWVIEGFRDR